MKLQAAITVLQLAVLVATTLQLRALRAYHSRVESRLAHARSAADELRRVLALLSIHPPPPSSPEE